MKIEEVKKLGLNLKNVDLNSLDNLSSFFEEELSYIDFSELDPSLKNDYISVILANQKRENLFISDTISDCVPRENFFNSKLSNLGYLDCLFVSDVRNIRIGTEKIFNDFLISQKNKDIVHYVGLKYNSDSELLSNILFNYPVIDIVELEVNYLDWINDSNFVRQNIDVCKKFNKKVIVSNTDKNKYLSDKFPSDLEDILRENDPYSSPRSWAIRFVNSLPDISLIVTNPISKKELYDDIITINYKDNEMTSSEINCLKTICKKLSC